VIAVDPGDAQVIAAIVAAAGAVIVAVVGVQWKVHSDNRTEHGQTSAKVDQLLENQGEFRQNITFIRSDLTTIRGEITELRGDVSDLRHTDHESESRITRLERHHHEKDTA
jgi:peptidoglycan hydrolase CwlO-like protein